MLMKMQRVLQKKKLNLKKSKNLYFCKIGLISKDYRNSIQEYIFLPNILCYQEIFNQNSLSSLKNLCVECLYKPTGDLRNFI